MKVYWINDRRLSGGFLSLAFIFNDYVADGELRTWFPFLFSTDSDMIHLTELPMVRTKNQQFLKQPEPISLLVYMNDSYHC